MRLPSLMLLAAGALFCAASCGGDSVDSLVKESKGVYSEMIDVLAGVTDAASAEKAKPELEALAKKMKEIADRGQALDQKSGIADRELDPEMEELSKKFFAEMMRVMQIDGAEEHISAALKSMDDSEK